MLAEACLTEMLLVIMKKMMKIPLSLSLPLTHCLVAYCLLTFGAELAVSLMLAPLKQALKQRGLREHLKDVEPIA